MASRSDLYPMINTVATMIAEARGRGDEATVNKLQPRMLDLVKLNEAWAKAEASGASVAPYIRDLQVQSRQVSMARLAADKAATAAAQKTFEATKRAATQYAADQYAKDTAPSFMDKVLATVQQAGLGLAIGAGVLLWVMFSGRRK